MLCFAIHVLVLTLRVSYSGQAMPSNWKDAMVKFGLHDSSKWHKEAVLKMMTLPSTTVSVADMLSEQNKREKRDRRHCFLKVLTSLKFLARQGR